MAIPQVLPYDHFYEWRAKTNQIASSLGDLESINVLAADRDTLVEALNKVIGNVGALASLDTTNKSSIVAAINEQQTTIGSGTLGTIAQTIIGSINEVFSSLLVGNALFTIGSEAANTIRVSVQLKGKDGNNLAFPAAVTAYLSNAADGSNLAASAPSGGWVIGTQGILIPTVAGKAGTAISNGSGLFNIDITEATAKTFYLVVALPLGNLKVSNAIAFT